MSATEKGTPSLGPGNSQVAQASDALLRQVESTGELRQVDGRVMQSRDKADTLKDSLTETVYARLGFPPSGDDALALARKEAIRERLSGIETGVRREYRAAARRVLQEAGFDRTMQEPLLRSPYHSDIRLFLAHAHEIGERHNESGTPFTSAGLYNRARAAMLTDVALIERGVDAVAGKKTEQLPLKPDPSKGFTLLELSIVLVIIGVISAGGIVGGVQMIESAKRVQTENKMTAIEKALLNWRTQYGRLPCPADASLAGSNANYGVEAASPGGCTGGVPAANRSDSTNFVVEGAVPFKALNLPEQFMYDGWDRKFVYAVQQKMTASATPGDVDAFAAAPINEACGMIGVKDPSAATRGSPVYTLVSVGSDGHGGYLRSGSRYSSGSGDADQQTNCHCDSSAVATAYTATYVQKDETSTFDDIVRFKERWQMPAAQSDSRAANYDGPELAVAHTTTPFVSIYIHSCDTFTKLANPASLPASTGMGAAWSGSNTYLAVAHTNSPRVTIYSRRDRTFTKLADPATLPAGNGRGVAWSPGTRDTFLAVAHATSPFVSIYSNSSGTFTKLSDPATLPASQGNGVAFSPDGSYLAVAHNNSPRVTIYNISGTTFTKHANPATLPAGNGNGVAWSPKFYVGATAYMYLAVAHATTPFVTIYKNAIVADTFTKLANPASLPASTGNGAAFTTDGKYLAVAHTTSPYVTIYSITTSTDTFTKIANPATLPASDGFGVGFSFDSRYMAVSHATSPYVTIYRFNSASDTLVKLTNPASLPAGQGNGIGFRNGPP